MNAKELITKDFLDFKKQHAFKDAEAKVTCHFIYGKILMAAQLNHLALDEAYNFIEVLFILYNALPSRN